MYIARRNHPHAGTLIKVGVSKHVYGRMAGLSATLIIADLPAELERGLLAHLAEWRVWTMHEGRIVGPNPIFAGYTEWFYSWPVVVDAVGDYLEPVAA